MSQNIVFVFIIYWSHFRFQKPILLNLNDELGHMMTSCFYNINVSCRVCSRGSQVFHKNCRKQLKNIITNLNQTPNDIKLAKKLGSNQMWAYWKTLSLINQLNNWFWHPTTTARVQLHMHEVTIKNQKNLLWLQLHPPRHLTLTQNLKL